MDESCVFCERLALMKRLNKRSNQGREKDMRYMAEYTVAIVERNWYKGMPKRNAGRTTHFKNRGIGFPLKFCPSCGKKVKRNG